MILGHESTKWALWLSPVIIAIALVMLLFLWQGTAGFSLWDEGFLWYVAQRTSLGDVPIRDIMAYDPGRYYWSAGIMSLLDDDGILGLRTAIAVFQVLGLGLALWIIAVRANHDMNLSQLALLGLIGLTLMIWMFPNHKIFDITVSIALVGSVWTMLSEVSWRRFLLAGFVVGLAAVFGRNHGLYGAVATASAGLWLFWTHSSKIEILKGGAVVILGVFLGFSPILLMTVLIPGFSGAFVESVVFMVKEKMNLPLPVPWPWTSNYAELSAAMSVRALTIGLGFCAVLAFPVIAIIMSARRLFQDKPVDTLLLACAFVGVGYAHHAFSRADVQHLAQGSFPLIIVGLVCLYRMRHWSRWAIAPLAVIISTTTFWPYYPGTSCRTSPECLPLQLGGDTLRVQSNVVNDVAFIRSMQAKYGEAEGTFISSSYWPGAYVVAGVKSPLWSVYTLVPYSETQQKREIERLRLLQPRFALIADFSLSADYDTRLQATMPLVYAHILKTMERSEQDDYANIKVYVLR